MLETDLKMTNGFQIESIKQVGMIRDKVMYLSTLVAEQPMDEGHEQDNLMTFISVANDASQ